MDNVSKYYCLSNILGDDTHLIAFVIRVYHSKELPIQIILKHLQALKLVDYMDTVDLILSMPTNAIIESSKGLVFNDEKEYVSYLVGLLDLNNVAYAKFYKAGEATHLQRGLF